MFTQKQGIEARRMWNGAVCGAAMIAATVVLTVILSLALAWVTDAFGNASEPPAVAEALCGNQDCTAYLTRPQNGQRRRLVLVAKDGMPPVVVLSNRRAVHVGVGQVCAACEMPDEEDLEDVTRTLNRLLWQSSLVYDFDCGAATPVIAKVYPHTVKSGPNVFQVDVRVGCF